MVESLVVPADMALSAGGLSRSSIASMVYSKIGIALALVIRVHL